MGYEEDVIRHGHLVKTWLRYLAFKEEAPLRVRFFLFERAVKELPRSYKLWHRYLTERVDHCSRLGPSDPAWEQTVGAFEVRVSALLWGGSHSRPHLGQRALVGLYTMPVIWQMYCNFLAQRGLVTRARHAFDRALRALPLTQHDRIWDLYVEFARECGCVETAVRVYRRYLKFAPESREELVEFLLESNFVDAASVELVTLMEDADYTPRSGRTRLQLWQQLCELVALHPDEVVSLRGRVEAIVRAGIERLQDNTGKLWTGLANHFIGLGLFDKARDVFEEAMDKVGSVRDFALVWDAYAEFEEGLLQALIDVADTDGQSDDVAFELQQARYESVVDRRPFLLSSVHLRIRPNDVNEWHARVRLYKERQEWANVALTYRKALKTIDWRACEGRLASLHVAYAIFYEHNKQLDEARKILDRAASAEFRDIDDLASIHCARAEMEIRARQGHGALELLREVCVAPPPHLRTARGGPVQERLYRSTKLWCLLADLEESFGTMEGVRAAYDTMFDLRIATPRVTLNYAAYLEEHHFFEDSFRAFERGVDQFDFPFSLEIWIAYLTKFVARYRGSKVERTRDLFEQAIEKVPREHAKTLYIMYADFEERYGLARHAMAVYDRATRAVVPEEQYVMFLLYISRATEFFGVTRTREIYEKAISVLPDKHMQDVCVRYAELEKRLGEVDRARVIYRHCSNFCDPRSMPSFWQLWHNFEVNYGNEETFREMLRIKRSVQTRFDTKINVMNAQRIAEIQAKIEAEMAERKALEQQPVSGSGGAFDPNALSIDLDDDAPERDVAVVQQQVPSAVFGSIKTESDGGNSSSKKRKI